ncbi:hypothetical protein K353_06139 [Kitasatospora sp. SolWspMP-SS2h]|uniref:hypothetical protein n=1 Tax=Kitasatospora sp. SolWspMP-SS2h TaxID=1305729 RepID=UPI000DB96A85|nr:hypothetical protein [Kitasatospora sp. SolWspMP-SS2h]RAJ31788.1 hypothetical protein K353_06139 [Kitasatospora sp. SolWspMP-SS2h]
MQAEQATAAAMARRALPCEDCGTPQVGGLCPTCESARAAKATFVEAVNAASAGTSHLNDPADVRAVVARVNAEVMAARPPGATRAEAFASDQTVAAAALADYRVEALRQSAHSP